MAGRIGNGVGLFAALSVALGCGHTVSNQPAPQESGGVSTAGSSNSSDGGGTLLPVGDKAAGGSSGANGGSGNETSGGAIEIGAGGDSETPMAGSGGMPTEISQVKPTKGCGIVATQATGTFVKFVLPTSGVKDANCADKLTTGQPVCGPWTLDREYYVWLPPGYDYNKPYPLVLEGPGCGGTGTTVYSLSPDNLANDAGVAASVIRVGLTPPPNSIGHGTNPGQGCFDDKEGDDSVDLVFFEKLLDTLKTQLCYDENRVYVSGNSSGAWLANELACKHAGDTQGHAVRGLATNMGGLPDQPQFSPTCSGKPVAGVWVRLTHDNTDPFDSNKFAIARAMKTNGCSSFDFDSALFMGQHEDFPIGGGKPADTCQRITQCASPEPLIVCTLPANQNQTAHDEVVNPAFSSFIRLLAAKP